MAQQESITVGYLPIQQKVMGKTVYHKFLIYTDKDGNQWAARGGPTSNGDPSKIGSASDGHRDENGNYDVKLTTRLVVPIDNNGNYYTGYTQRYDENFVDNPNHPSRMGIDSNSYGYETIATGENLSGKWEKIIEGMQKVDQLGLPYYADGENSNSAVDTEH